MTPSRISRRAVLIAGGSAGLAHLLADAAAAQQGAETPPQPATPSPPHPIEIIARPLDAFDRTHRDRTRFGRLEFRGGLVLTSQTRDFGGWSGLVLDDDGRRLIAVSDEGSWMTGEIAYDGNRPVGIRGARLGPILGTGGRPLARKRDSDAESITLLDGTLGRGTALIAFERNRRIGRFPLTERGLEAPVGYLKLPTDAARMSPNKGFESVGVIRGGPMRGAVIAFAEEMYDQRRHHTGWIWSAGPGGDPQRLNLVNHADFAITDVASFADGSLLILERKFRWLEGVRMRLRLVRAADIRPGALLDGEVLIEADMSSEIDNMEGLALSRGPRGEVVVTMISDDNFNHLLQRTVLLQFTLMGLPSQAAARP